MRTSFRDQGKISNHFEGAGTVTAAMVQQRAREIALISGRPDGRYIESDWREARRELLGISTDAPNNEEDLIAWDENPNSSGHQTPNLQAADPEVYRQKLVEEGMEEAEHDRMLEGSKSGRNQG
jgi:hypothetical protein